MPQPIASRYRLMLNYVFGLHDGRAHGTSLKADRAECSRRAKKLDWRAPKDRCGNSRIVIQAGDYDRGSMLTELLLLPDPVLMTICGFFIGLLVGMTGVGAGALTTPMLISGFGVAPAVAVGTDLLFAGITKSGGAWHHNKLGHVNWPILSLLALGSVSAAICTLIGIYYFKPDQQMLGHTIRYILAIALLTSAVAIPLIPTLIVRTVKARSRKVKMRPVSTVTMGIILGVIVTLTSVGAGAIGVAILSFLYPMLRARHIVGTDIVHAVPLTLLSGLGHLSIGNIDYAILAALLIGSLPGIMLGSRLTAFVPDVALRFILSAVLAFSAYLVIVKF